MSNKDEHKWCFKKEQYQQFLNNNEYKTEEFSIAGFKWTIDCGLQNNQFNLFLTLQSELPPDVDYILVQHNHKCIDTHSSLTLMTEYDHQTKAWGAGAEILSLQEMQNIKDRILFQVSIKIIQIVAKKQVLFVDRLVVKNQDAHKIVWIVDNELMNYFKTAYNGKLFESQLTNDSMFIIRCCPNGYSPDHKGHVSFGIRIIHWPFIDAKLYRVKFSLSCDEIEMLKTYEGTFTLETPTRGWPSIDVNFEYLQEIISELQSKHKQLKIILKYEILEYVDICDNKISKRNENYLQLINNNDYNKCLQLLKITSNQDVIPNSIPEDKKEKEEKDSENYNEDVVNKLLMYGVGTKDECIAASKLVNDPNNIDDVADKVYEIRDVSIQQPQHDEGVSNSNSNSLRINCEDNNHNVNRRQDDKEEKEEKQSENYNEDIVNQLVNAGIGTKDACIEASKLVNDPNDIWVVANKILEMNTQRDDANTNNVDSLPIKIKVEENEDASNHNENTNNMSENEIKDDVKTFLESLELGDNYYKTFIENGFDNMKFIRNSIGNDDLEKIGIKLYGHKKRILDAANGLDNRKRALKDEKDENAVENKNDNDNSQPPKKKSRNE